MLFRHYRHRVAEAPRPALLAPLLNLVVNTFPVGEAKELGKKFQNTESNKKNFRPGKLTTSHELAQSFFKQLPEQLLLLQWGVGFYKNLTKNNTECRKKSVYKLFLSLADALNYLSKQRRLKSSNREIIQKLLAAIHSVSFFIDPDDRSVAIQTEIQWRYWQQLLMHLLAFEESVQGAKKIVLAPVMALLERLDEITISIAADCINRLDLLEEVAINKLTVQLHAKARPQWLIIRLETLKDELADFQLVSTQRFSVFKYFITEIFPEARRLAQLIKEDTFVLDVQGYRRLLTVLEMDSCNKLSMNEPRYYDAKTEIISKASFFSVNRGNISPQAANVHSPYTESLKRA